MTDSTSTASEPARIARRAALIMGAAAVSAIAVGAARPAQAAAARRMKVTVLYGQPKDPAAFEKYYAETHLPIAAKMTGVRHLELSKALPGGDGSPAPFYRIAELYFDSKAKMDKTLASQAGKDTVADLPNFATGGFTIVVSELAPRKRS